MCLPTLTYFRSRGQIRSGSAVKCKIFRQHHGQSSMFHARNTRIFRGLADWVVGHRVLNFPIRRLVSIWLVPHVKKRHNNWSPIFRTGPSPSVRFSGRVQPLSPIFRTGPASQSDFPDGPSLSVRFSGRALRHTISKVLRKLTILAASHGTTFARERSPQKGVEKESPNEV
jgi:hypothetical protein